VGGSPLEATDPSGMMTNYEMRMTDPRWDALTEERGPSIMVAGVPYAGNSLWVGGFKAQELNSFGMDLMLTRGEQQALGLLPRKLTSEEIQHLGALCGATDCHRIQVYDGWLQKGAGLTIGYTIFMGKPVTSNGSSSYFGTLAHEVMHTVQFTWWLEANAVAAPPSMKGAAFPVTWIMWMVGMSPSPIKNAIGYDIYSPSPGDFWSQSFEQQGAIIEGCFGAGSGCDRSPYQPGPR
jgi:hypothetical protein